MRRHILPVSTTLVAALFTLLTLLGVAATIGNNNEARFVLGALLVIIAVLSAVAVAAGVVAVPIWLAIRAHRRRPRPVRRPVEGSDEWLMNLFTGPPAPPQQPSPPGVWERQVDTDIAHIFGVPTQPIPLIRGPRAPEEDPR